MEQGAENRPADSKSPPPLPGDDPPGVTKDEGVVGSTVNKTVLAWSLTVIGIIGITLVSVGVALFIYVMSEIFPSPTPEPSEPRNNLRGWTH